MIPLHARAAQSDGAPSSVSIMRDDSVHLHNRACWVEEEDLMPVLCKARAVVRIGDSMSVQVLLERVDVVGAVGDVSDRTYANRVDDLITPESDSQILSSCQQ